MHTLSIGAHAYRVSPWQFLEDDPMPDPDPIASMVFNSQKSVLPEPVVFWVAKPMMSHSTGIRPEGEAVHFHGAWWKLEAWTSSKIYQDILRREMFNVTINAFPTFPTGSILGSAEDPVKDLSRSIDKALRSGMSREQIMLLVDLRAIVVTMED